MITQSFYRNQNLDISKGIGIMLVVLGHYLNVDSFPNAFIRSFHMPLFFIISGACFNFERNIFFKEFIKKRSCQLVVPVITFSLITLLTKCLLERNLNAIYNLHWQLPGVLWFLLILYFTELIAWQVISFLKHERIVSYVIYILIAILFAIAIGASKLCLWSPFSLLTLFSALAFYILGYKGKCIILKVSIFRYKWLQLILSFSFCALVVKIVGNSMQMYCNQICCIDILTAIAGTWGVFMLSAIITNFSFRFPQNILFWLGRNTLCIMCTHLLLIEFAFRTFGGTINNYVLKHIVCLMFVFVGLYIVTDFINKYIPWALGKDIYNKYFMKKEE